MTATGFKSKYSWTQPAKKKNKKKNAVVVYPCCSSWSTAEQHSENCLVRLGGAARPLRTPASDGQHIDKRKTCPGSPTSTRLTPGGARQMFTLHRLRHSVAKHAYACSTSPKTPRRLNGVSGVRGGFFFFLSFFFGCTIEQSLQLNLAVVEEYYFNMSLILTHGQEQGVRDITR